MAVHIHSRQESRAIGSHMPLEVALAVLPTLPRPLLARFVANAIDRLDVMDGEADLEPEVTEQDDEPEIDDPDEEDDHSGGNVEDEGEREVGMARPDYGVDQSQGPQSPYAC